jgi:hypothetical protein
MKLRMTEQFLYFHEFMLEIPPLAANYFPGRLRPRHAAP